MQFLCKRSAFLFFTLALLTPWDGVAQTVKNEIGIYTSLSAEPSSASIDIDVGVAFDVYMILINPVNESFPQVGCGEPVQRPINVIPAIQFALIRPESGMYTLEELPNGVVALRATYDNDLVIVFEGPILVPESRNTLLMSYKLMVVDLDPKFLYLQPTVNQPSNGLLVVDGEAGSLGCSAELDIQDVFPSSGDYNLPVFGINASVVATDNRSWGGVKALFR